MNERLSGLVAACVILLGPVAHAGALDDARDGTEAALSRAKDGTPLCFPPVQGAARAHVIHVHSGKEPLDPAITRNTPTSVDVVVERTAEPALLVLSGVGPILWNIRAGDGATIAGVHLTGDSEQFVSGLDEGVPVGRAFSQMISGKRAPRCRNWVKAAGPDADREALRKLENELNSLMRRRMVLEVQHGFLLEKYLKLAKAREKQRVEMDPDSKRNRAPYFEMLKEEERAKITDLYGQGEAINAKMSDIKTRMRRFSGKAARPTVMQGQLDVSGAVARYASRLKELGDFELASHKKFPPRTATTVTLSQADVEAFVARKREGERILAADDMPDFPVLSADAPMMTAPKDREGNDGLAYLVERGYLGLPDDAARYACDKERALMMVEGVEPPETCPTLSSERMAYTVLGPVTVPEGVCRITYYVPPGVPAPQGLECRSYTRYLACSGVRDMRERIDCVSRLQNAARE